MLEQMIKEIENKTIFLVIALGIIVLTILLLFSAGGFVRLFAGIPFIFLLPGYLFLLLLWPSDEGINQLRRIALIIPTSVAIVGILLLIVNYFFTYQFELVVIAIAVLELLLTIAALLRSPSQLSWQQQITRARSFFKSLISYPWHTKHIILIVSFLVFTAALFYAIYAPRQGRDVTEFYFQGSEVLAKDFPRGVQVGEPLNVTLVVRNLESGTHTYRVEGWAVDPFSEDRLQLVAESPPLTLPPDQTIEWPVTWSMPFGGDDQQVAFTLFIDSQPDPYRHLILLLDVAE